MASDLDTVRVLKALFNDMPQAPKGLSHPETVAWIQRSMTDFEGGDMAYALEHITRSSMLDIVLRMREDGPYREDAAFDTVVQQISTPDGRKTFMDWCINARKSVDATARLLNRAKPTWSEPRPLFQADPEQVEQFVAGEPTGAGPMFAEYAARDDVRAVGVLEAMPEHIYEFDWGFLTEDRQGWSFYLAAVWRQGTVGYFERFLCAWRLETGSAPPAGLPPAPAPFGLEAEPGIVRFCSLVLQGPAGTAETTDPAQRRWLGEVFISHMLPVMAGRALDPDYDFPLAVQTQA